METKCYIIVQSVGDMVEWVNAFKKRREALQTAEENAKRGDMVLVDVGEDVWSWYNKDTKQSVLLTQSWYNS